MNGEKLTVITNKMCSRETLVLGCSVLCSLLCSIQVGPNQELCPSPLRICLPQRNSALGAGCSHCCPAPVEMFGG